MNPVIIYGISLVMIISLLYVWIKGKVDLWRFISYGFIIILFYVILFEIFQG